MVDCDQHEVADLTSAIQYVRCTLQKSPEEVESCVAQNAVKVDWLPQIQAYTGATSCASNSHWLIGQVAHVLRSVLSPLLSVLWWQPLWKRIQKIFRSTYRKQNNKDVAIELKEFHEPHKHVNRASMTAKQRGGYINRTPWVPETRYTLKATLVLQSIGREVLVSFLTVLVLKKSGAYVDKNNSFNDEISFYVVRPRSAPFVGLMGLFTPWSK